MPDVTVPFDCGFFFNAMISLLGREPDSRHLAGLSGYYSFRYEPKDEAEAKKFDEAIPNLQRWLKLFTLTPFESRCEFGRLLHPQKGEEGKDFLEIIIVHPVEKRIP